MAVSSSAWHIIGSTTARFGLTAKPAGHALLRLDRGVVVVHPLLASSGSMKENDSAPMPLVAARWIVSRRLHATHSGGCGFCSGLGTTLRGGICSHSPVVAGERLLDEHARDGVERLVPLLALLLPRRRRSRPAPASDDVSPVPNSTRPSEIRSSVAMRSATRAVGLKSNGICDDAVTEPDALVRWLAAARNTSGAEEWLYSSRKWCSTSHT